MVNGERIETKERIRYLRDIFNKKGDNEDLIKDRVYRDGRFFKVSVKVILVRYAVKFPKKFQPLKEQVVSSPY